MRESGEKFAEEEAGGLAGVAAEKFAACFWRRSEAIASRMSSPVKGEREELFAESKKKKVGG
jgi:hypothetical protein